MAKKRSRGRPKLPKGQAKQAVFLVRLSSEEKGAMKEAARRTGRSLSEWGRNVLIQASKHG